MLKLLFVILMYMQSLVAYGDTTRYNPSKFLSFDPRLEVLGSKYGKSMFVLAGSDEPYTGAVSITSSVWKDVVFKESFVDGKQSLNTRIYYSKSTGEKLNGEFESYYPDGAKYGVINLVNGKRDGITTVWHPNGKLKSIHNYSMGIENGDFSIFYENGNKEQTGIAGPNDSRQWTDWNISGYKESFYNFKYKDKPPISSKHWDSEGRRDREWVDRYDNGTMFKRKYYTHGDPALEWTSWYPNGTKHTEINFMFGLLNGSVKYWNKEGVLAVDGQFKDSKEVGKWVFKDNDGNLIQRPKNFHVNIADGNDPIEIVNQNNKERNMIDLYISIQIPLAIAILIFLPLLGAGIAVYVLRRRRRR